jgi:hypothetical protein
MNPVRKFAYLGGEIEISNGTKEEKSKDRKKRV